RDANLSYAILRGAIFCNTVLPDGGVSNKDC
ncbi:MAG: pentapeptide repeat-containing protein, partial [bacterium]